MLEAALQSVAEEGLVSLTFGRLAERLGVPDRTVVYYFPTKQDLVRAVVSGHSAHLTAVLGAALGDEPLAPAEVVARAWPALRTDAADSAFRVFFEVVGHAAAGRPPYRDLAADLVGHWVDWLAERGTGPQDRRRERAAGLLAQLDGLLLLRHIGRPDLADAAALGIATEASAPPPIAG